MKKTNKLLSAILATSFTISVTLTGCASDRPEPPIVVGYDDEEWVWDEENEQWGYDQDGDGDLDAYWYGGSLRKSVKKGTTFLKSSGFGKSSPKFGG